MSITRPLGVNYGTFAVSQRVAILICTRPFNSNYLQGDFYLAKGKVLSSHVDRVVRFLRYFHRG